MIRAKMRCDSKADGEYAGKPIVNVTLRPVYDPDPNSENGQFYASTPGGQVDLGIMNPKAAEGFEVNALYYVDFTKAE
jgi:hypothetical protein